MSGCGGRGAEGLSAAKIGEKLGTTRGAVLGRLHRLSGVALTYPSYTRQANETRARNAARMKERKRITDAAISKMRHEIARGVERGVAVRRRKSARAVLLPRRSSALLMPPLARVIHLNC